MPGFTQKRRGIERHLTGRLALSCQWTDDIMSYASVARDYASSGFDKGTNYVPIALATPRSGHPSHGPMRQVVKAQLTDELRVKDSVFYNAMRDGQLSAFDAATWSVFYANQDYRGYAMKADAIYTLANGLEFFCGFAAIKFERVNLTPEAASASAGFPAADPRNPVTRPSCCLPGTRRGSLYRQADLPCQLRTLPDREGFSRQTDRPAQYVPAAAGRRERRPGRPENGEAKLVRNFLRTHHHLTAKTNRVRMGQLPRMDGRTACPQKTAL